MVKTAFITAFLLCFCTVITWAQDADEPTESSRHEIGVNGFILMQRMLNPEFEMDENILPVLYYKYREGPGYIRFGWEGDYSKFKDSPKTIEWRSRQHLGYELRAKIINKFKFMYGAEAYGQITKRTTITQRVFDKVTVKSTDYIWGAGGFGGIHFDITPRVAMFTEMRFTVQRGEQIQRSESERSIPGSDTKSKSAVPTELQFTLPNTVFFVIKF